MCIKKLIPKKTIEIYITNLGESTNSDIEVDFSFLAMREELLNNSKDEAMMVDDTESYNALPTIKGLNCKLSTRFINFLLVFTGWLIGFSFLEFSNSPTFDWISLISRAFISFSAIGYLPRLTNFAMFDSLFSTRVRIIFLIIGLVYGVTGWFLARALYENIMELFVT